MVFKPLKPGTPFHPVQAVTSGANPVSIKKGIDKTCAHLVAKLKELSRPVKGNQDIRVRFLINPLHPATNHHIHTTYAICTCFLCPFLHPSSPPLLLSAHVLCHGACGGHLALCNMA